MIEVETRHESSQQTNKPTLIKNSSNYLPSMTPAFPEENETMSRNPSKVTSPKTESSIYKLKSVNANKNVTKQPHILVSGKHTTREPESVAPEEMTMCQQQKFIQNMQMMKQSSGMDIFSTMEQEMKQIMDLFAKERKARKKEILKLKAKLQEKDDKLKAERE